MVANPRLDLLFGPKIWLIFNQLNANDTWLQKDVDNWNADQEYVRIKGSLHVLKVVNDLAEQCVKDIQEYADLAKDSHYQQDIPIVEKIIE